ncbi:alpha/beta hydrolase family protein [Swaminathania salitolerans]|uniref:Dienelactone hydrolase n=1 Tax=Swaminathania salitolerans TaxID=182838 RepID=A0A511BS84_9PROT|nr:hypothetical protein [Swaminathania salitolerans]GEL03196.1 dienelactone hydrolase [Swaminathania salitolerans]
MPAWCRLPLTSLILACCFGPAMARTPDPGDPARPSVGCQHLVTPEGLELGIWYPSTGKPDLQALGPYAEKCVVDGPIRQENHALIVISHGTGGSWTSHLDSAAFLAQAGYIVMALTEPGDNWRDTTHATDLAGRTRAMSAALTYMLTAWPSHRHIDRHSIGAYGFSAGGLTVLLAAGAMPDLTRTGPWCARYPASFTCALIAGRRNPAGLRISSLRDRRFRAIAIAAPALGFTMTRDSLAPVTLPVQLWQALDDAILPSPGSVEPVRDHLPLPSEFHAVEKAGHFDFLAPCRPGYDAMALCRSAPGFDRIAFHDRFNRALMRFYDRTVLGEDASARPHR